MRATVDLDQETEIETGIELTHVAGLTREKPAIVLRQAIRLGLPILANRTQVPQSAG
jgi:hypothetical protein